MKATAPIDARPRDPEVHSLLARGSELPIVELVAHVGQQPSCLKP